MKTIHCLFVDDETDMELLFKLRFKEEVKNHQVELFYASSAKKGMEILDSEVGADILLIISDINMPEIDGFKFIDMIQEKYNCQLIYIVSAYNQDEYVEKATERNVDRYLTKPLDFDKLKKYINEDVRKLG
jgi:YesN/AraC family two-component response regulator